MKKLSVRIGDIFAVPVQVETGHHGFVLGRIISEESSWLLIEIFETLFQDVPTRVDPWMMKKRLFRPVFMKFLFTDIPKWRVIQRNPSFDKREAGYENIRIAFRYALPPLIWEQGKTRVAKAGELDGLEPSIVWFPERIATRIAAHLRGDLGPNDTYLAWLRM
ncbi:MAG TPA: hypothetical protein VFS27_07495 [Blastocatellia bacterium]|jgi:hypothetical protein|nr:hypothetical protein [Blastocatellia bacterium]